MIGNLGARSQAGAQSGGRTCSLFLARGRGVIVSDSLRLGAAARYLGGRAETRIALRIRARGSNE